MTDTHKRVSRVRRAEISGQVLHEVTKPEFVTLTGLPSNRRPFKIVRSDTQEDNMSTKATKKPATRASRARRNDSANNLLSITFPAAYTDEQILARLDEFGMGEESPYKLTRKDDGTAVAARDDVSTEGSSIAQVMLTADGITAQVVRKDGQEPTPAEGSRLEVTSITFDTSIVSEEQIESFLSRFDVDTTAVTLDTSVEGKSVLVRSDVTDGTETKQIQVEDGVIFTVKRSDCEDIPEGYVAVVNECMYGNYGWGHLDFLSALADRAVCEKLDDASYRLTSVLNNILFNSGLPVEARKVLVQRSTEQYAAYINTLLDMLPRQVLVAIDQLQRNDKATTESTMKQPNDNAGQPVTRSDESAATAAAATAAAAPAAAAAPDAAAAPAAAPAAGTAAGETITMSRADLEALMKSTATAAAEEALARKDTPALTPEQQAEAEAAAAAAAEDAQPLTRGDFRKMLQEQQQNTVFVRSDDGDTQVVIRKDSQENKQQRSDGEVFAGVLGNIRKN